MSFYRLRHRAGNVRFTDNWPAVTERVGGHGRNGIFGPTERAMSRSKIFGRHLPECRRKYIAPYGFTPAMETYNPQTGYPNLDGINLSLT